MDRAEFAAAQWRKERPDLNLVPMTLLGRIAEASQIIARDRLEPVFARYGLKRGEFDVIATLRRAGTPFALTPTELYRSTMVSSGGMTARLDRLETAGLIARKPNAEDRRGMMVALTPRGLTLIDEMIGAHVANQEAIVSALSGREQEQLSALLGKLIGGLVETANR